ncbi:CDF family Co(II)/Ni(II) efflux transporter DmeF, partial [bacterium]|nr:CDF family Co(II)/Ni(II) efflux transporter DmeF [bacterium]MBU1024931.1 CDF family Co(II)/Ni(II) efflux transporter DmeF [bacterium]
MHDNFARNYSHSHITGVARPVNERRTLQVVILTLVTMVAEISAGYITGSMALLADGWHMGTHAFALGISFSAYVLARRHADSPSFSFGTGKFGVLAGYSSALFLGAAALFMIYQSIFRFVHPVNIAFNEAIFVAVIGLIVNIVSILILQDREHHHHHEHNHEHDNKHNHSHHQDHNYRAAYLHVIADALTSLLAITALLLGKFYGLIFMDPVMGIVGGVMICRWSYHLIRATAFILVD